jgi:hypothetical protein
MTDGEDRCPGQDSETSKGNLRDCSEVTPGPKFDQRTSSTTAARNRLPNRRPAETITFERDGSQYCLTVGFFPDGSIGELFLNADRGDSPLDVLMHDAAILASLAL